MADPTSTRPAAEESTGLDIVIVSFNQPLFAFCSLTHQKDPLFAQSATLDDGDSVLGEEVDLSTASLSSSILEYRKIHGRTYHNFGGTERAEYW